MPFQPCEFLDFAKRIAEGTSEAEMRTCISRAYYAVFLLARETLKKRTLYKEKEIGKYLQSRNKRGGTHEYVICKFKDMQNSDANHIADLLQDLKAKRVEADYELNTNITKDVVEETLYNADCAYKMLLNF